MKYKSLFTGMSALALLYSSSANASTVTTSYTGEVLGLNGAVGDVFVSFSYDTGSPGSFNASATVGGFGSYTANYFKMVTSSDHYIYLSAPTVSGTTTTALHLYGDFYNWSPSDFVFDRRSNVQGNTYGMPSFSVIMDNGWVVTTAGYSVGTVPVPAAVWLFGAGLLGLAGLARRK